MKNADIKSLSTEELKDKIAGSQKSLLNLRFANRISSLENPMQIRDVKRLVARLKTELHSRVAAELEVKVKSGELDKTNAREFLKENKLDSGFKLGKINKIISRTTAE